MHSVRHAPKVHEDQFELLTSDAEVFEVDDDLSDLREVGHGA